MHRLFWKIFSSFWLALVLFAAATMLVASSYIDNMREREETESPFAKTLTYLAEARQLARREGVSGLKAWLAALDRRELIPYRLVNPQGEDLLGRAVPGRAVTFLERRQALGGESRRRDPLQRHQVTLPDGQLFYLIADHQSITLARVLRRPRVIALPLVVAALVSVMVCFALARYVTAPVSRLRRATEQLASGDLKQRVTPTLGGRRDEIADLARDFDHMAERLEHLIGSQHRLLRDVSHELRSPLARLQVAVGLARQRKGGDIGAELDRMERDTERLNDLIGQLLSLARLESDAAPQERETVDLAELLETVAKDASFEAQARNRDLLLAPVDPVCITANAPLLHSALENVVRNAIRYTAEGSAVELSLTRESPGRVQIRVRDHGHGVPEQMLPHLFEPFVRVDDARDRESGGHGLGLAIAERAIRLHGGRMSARNETGGGLSILMDLPLAATHTA